MVSRFHTSAARKRSSHGNVILESVFTLLPTFAFIFAFTDFGLMMFRWSTLQNSLREATRYAVTFQTNAGQGQDASIESVVQQYALGFVKTTDSPQHIFVNYYAPTALNTAFVTRRQRTRQLGGRLYSEPLFRLASAAQRQLRRWRCVLQKHHAHHL